MRLPGALAAAAPYRAAAAGLLTAFYQEGIILEKVQSLLAGFQPGAEITEYIPVPDDEVPAMIEGF